MVIRNNQFESVFTITEDNHMTIKPEQLLPSEILAELYSSNFLFMGISFSDWCVRHFFLNIWNRARRKYTSWTVQEDTDLKEKKFWDEYGVDILNIPLDKCITDLNSLLKQHASEGDRL